MFYRKGIIFLILLISLFALGVSAYRVTKVIETFNKVKSYKIIVDAGHGKPDGGAVSKTGVEEASLNLEIAKKLKEGLEAEGFLVLMTREDENNIADSNKQKSLREMKSSDLTNRVNIANNSGADIMISIHMNKFDGSSSWGWQTFYGKKSEEGKELAILVQNAIQKHIDKKNKRVALSIEGIKIIDKTNIPAIIVECGFLSNEEDLSLLQTEDYQNKLVNGIIDGIKEFYAAGNF